MSIQLDAGALLRDLDNKLKDSSLSRAQADTIQAVRKWISYCGEQPLELSKDEPTIPPQALCFFKDGNQICCVFGDFINLQESPAGFGKTYDEAFADLEKNYNEWKNKRTTNERQI